MFIGRTQGGKGNGRKDGKYGRNRDERLENDMTVGERKEKEEHQEEAENMGDI